MRNHKIIKAMVLSAAALALATPLAYAGPSSPAATASSSGAIEHEVVRYLKQHPAGDRTSKYQVSFRNGHVRMNFVPAGQDSVSTSPAARPESARTAEGALAGTALALTSYLNGCPFGNTTKWYCFYEHSNYKGRMLQFKDCRAIIGVKQNLNDYVFGKKTSSWTNTSDYTGIDVFANPDWSQRLWVENHGPTTSSYVGAAANDRAQTFTGFC